MRTPDCITSYKDSAHGQSVCWATSVMRLYSKTATRAGLQGGSTTRKLEPSLRLNTLANCSVLGGLTMLGSLTK